MSKPKILALDIETAPIELLGWQLYDANFNINQIQKDWSVLAWSAKFVGKSKVYYSDTSKQKDVRDDKTILKGIHELIEEADILLSQNGIRFDVPKLNARFIANGLAPLDIRKKPHIDTKKVAKRTFGFTSNSLEYLCQILKVKHKKLTHRRFAGFDLWKECLARNPSAWAEMKAYNIRDVVALEEVYKKLAPWGTGVSLNIDGIDKPICPECGNHSLRKEGKRPRNGIMRQRFQCASCGAWAFANIKKDGTLGRVTGQ